MNTPKNTTSPRPKISPLIWWVVAVFAVQIAVWTAWITFAAKHKVAEVPLVNTR